MDAKVFIDTNIWVYAKIEGKDIKKHNEAASFLRKVKNQLFISTQVVNEFYNALAKNNIQGIDIETAIEQILPAIDLQIITLSTIKISWKIKEKYGFSLYDSLIIASALEARCTILYTEDLQHNQIIENKLKIINPFID